MLIDDDQCAALLRCSKSHLQRLARAGEIPGTKIGRGWVFVEEDVVQLVRTMSAPKPVPAPKAVGRPRKRIV